MFDFARKFGAWTLTKSELLRLAAGNNFGRNSDQKLNGNRFSRSHGRLEFPSAERETRRFIHLRHDALINLKVIHGAVFPQHSLKNYQLACPCPAAHLIV